MRTVRIRTFTLFGLYLIFMIPWLFYLAAHFMETGALRFGEGMQDDRLRQSHVAEIMQMIESGSGHWTEPAWQSRLHDRLRAEEMDMVISDCVRSGNFSVQSGA